MDEMYYYWLHNVPGIGRLTVQKILKYITPKELYESKEMKQLDFLTEKQRENIEISKKRWEICKEWEKLQSRGIGVLGLRKSNYPVKLSTIPDPSPIIYYKGNCGILDKPSVAVIGARACSNYGSLAAKELGKELAAMGIVVVSGMARGIDSICQCACLEYGGESIGVLGSGVEVCYPSENKFLYEKLQKQGCLISENLPDTPPNAGLFPLRNRIISGLADVIVVVESREKSGTQITVDMALEQGKEVYAMPGRVTDPVSRGCNKLIKQGAGMVLSPREFVEEICPMLQLKYQQNKKEPQLVLNLNKEEQIIVKYLNISVKTLEEIYQGIKEKNPEITINRVMESVLELQMRNILKEENGYYGVNDNLMHLGMILKVDN